MMVLYVLDPVEQLASRVARAQLDMDAALAQLASPRDRNRLARLVALLMADQDDQDDL